MKDKFAESGAAPRQRADAGGRYPAVEPRAPEAEESLFDLRNLLRILRRRAWLLVGITALITAAAAVWTQSLTPRYTAETLIMLGGREERVVDLEAVLGGLPRDALASELQVIRSRELARRVAEKLELEHDPLFNPALSPPAAPSLVDRVNPLPWLRAHATALVLEPLRLADPAEPAATPRATLPPDVERERLLDGLAGRVRAGLEASEIRGTRVVAVRYTSTDPATAARLADAFAEMYLLEQLEAKFDATRRASAWLETRLSDLREEVRAAESAVAAYRTEQGLIDAAGVTALEGQVADLNGQVIMLRAERVEKEARLARVRRLANAGGNLETLGDVAGSGAIVDLRQQRIALDRREAELGTRYGDRHPEMVNLRAEQRDVQRAVDSEIARVIAALENDVALAVSRERSVETSRDELQRQFNEQHSSLVRLQELQRHASTTRALYESFLTRFKETEQQDGIAQADGHIISKATTPGGPSYPNNSRNVQMGLLLGLMLGMAAVFLVEKLDNGVRTAQDAESLLGVPALGLVPLIPRGRLGGKAPTATELIVDRPLGQFAEAIRALRTAVAISDIDSPPKVVLVTSSLPGEGKTTLAGCMALSAAGAGKRAIVIDCDLRRPGVHRLFGHKPAAGLVELLTQRAALEDVLVTSEDTRGVDYVPVAAGAPNPADVLGSRSMRDLLARLRETYDLIVLDSPPTMAVSDATVLATMADTTLFVVRWEKTARQAATGGLRSILEVGAPVAGAALNAVDMRRQPKYAYGESSAYYGRYRYYYSD